MKKILISIIFVAMAAPLFAKEVLPFIDNDYSKAIAQARTKKLPLFVDAWAPW